MFLCFYQPSVVVSSEPRQLPRASKHLDTTVLATTTTLNSATGISRYERQPIMTYECSHHPLQNGPHVLSREALGSIPGAITTKRDSKGRFFHLYITVL